MTNPPMPPGMETVDEVVTQPPAQSVSGHNELRLPSQDDSVYGYLDEDLLVSGSRGAVILKGAPTIYKVDYALKARWTGLEWQFLIRPDGIDQNVWVRENVAEGPTEWIEVK